MGEIGRKQDRRKVEREGERGTKKRDREKVEQKTVRKKNDIKRRERAKE